MPSNETKTLKTVSEINPIVLHTLPYRLTLRPVVYLPHCSIQSTDNMREFCAGQLVTQLGTLSSHVKFRGTFVIAAFLIGNEVTIRRPLDGFTTIGT